LCRNVREVCVSILQQRMEAVRSTNAPQPLPAGGDISQTRTTDFLDRLKKW
jgi:hypothetical protein